MRLLLLVVVILAGCGGSSSSSDEGNPNTTDTPHSAFCPTKVFRTYSYQEQELNGGQVQALRVSTDFCV